MQQSMINSNKEKERGENGWNKEATYKKKEKWIKKKIERNVL